jgi:hypothetical protein
MLGAASALANLADAAPLSSPVATGGRPPSRANRKQKHIASPTLGLPSDLHNNNNNNNNNNAYHSGGAGDLDANHHDYGLRPTEATRSLTIGSEVEVRWFDEECGLRGSWYAAKIIEMMPGPAPAPHFYFYRIECVDLLNPSGREDDFVKEWMPLATPALWDKEEVVVHIRTLPKTRAYHPIKNLSTAATTNINTGTAAGNTITNKSNLSITGTNNSNGTAPSNEPAYAPASNFPKLKKGQRIEAYWGLGWWMGFVRSIKANGAKIEVDFDDAPLGEGGEPMEFLRHLIRPAHPREQQWFGMLEPGEVQNNFNLGAATVGAVPVSPQQQPRSVVPDTSPNGGLLYRPKLPPLPEPILGHIATLPPDQLILESNQVDIYRQNLKERVELIREVEADILAHEQRISERKNAVREMYTTIMKEENKAKKMAEHVRQRQKDISALNSQLQMNEAELRLQHDQVKNAIIADGQRTAVMLGEQVKVHSEEAKRMLADLELKKAEAQNRFDKMLLQLQPDGGQLGRLVQEKAVEIQRKETELNRKAVELEERKHQLFAMEMQLRSEQGKRMQAVQTGIQMAHTAIANAAINANARALPSLPHLQHQYVHLQLQQQQRAPAPAVPRVVALPQQQQQQQHPLSPQQAGTFIMQRQQQPLQYQMPMQFIPINNTIGTVGDGAPAAAVGTATTTATTASPTPIVGKQSPQRQQPPK